MITREQQPESTVSAPSSAAAAKKGKTTLLTETTISASGCPSSGCGAKGASAGVSVRYSRSGRRVRWQPSAELRGRIARVLPAVDALFDECHTRPKDVSGDAVLGRNPPCNTIFWLAARTGRLTDFWTRNPRYRTPTGVHVDMTTAAAEHASHETATFGCGGAALGRGTAKTFLILRILGARLGKPPRLRAIGGHSPNLTSAKFRHGGSPQLLGQGSFRNAGTRQR